MFLKVMHGPQTGDHSIYDDVTACHFKRYPEKDSDSFGEAKAWCREPVKTGMVSGYVEVEKLIVLCGNAYLMNEQGRTISKFEDVESGPR